MDIAGELKTYFASGERADSAELKRDIDVVCRNAVVDGLLHSVGGLLAVLNRHRQIISVNDSFLKAVHAGSSAEILGLRPGEALRCVHSNEMPGGCGTSQYCSTCGAAIAIVATLAANISQDKTCAMTVRKNGSAEDVCFKVKASPLSSGESTYVLLFLQDVSKEVWRASLERVFFHDLNNIIGGLVGVSELMAEEDISDVHRLIHPMRQLVQRLENEVRIQSILSRTSSLEYKVKTEKIGIDDLNREIADIFRVHPVAHGRSLRISAVPGDIVFETDRELLIRILVNMIKNAFEAAGHAEEVRFLTEAAPGKTVFSVWNRQAIPDDVARRVFQRHFSTKDEEGRGFGTYSMKLFGEHVLNGRVGFTSSPAEGTTFFLSLPGGTPSG